MKINPVTVAIGAGAVGLLLVGLMVWKKGGVTGAATAAGGAAVDAAVGLTSGAVGAIGAQVGLPTPSETTTDAAVARWIIDNRGHLAASQWAGLPAYVRALGMDAGSGSPPAPGTAAARALPAAGTMASYDEGARLLRRYPAPIGAPESDGAEYFSLGVSP